jgi:hypothetical protein
MPPPVTGPTRVILIGSLSPGPRIGIEPDVAIGPLALQKLVLLYSPPSLETRAEQLMPS